MAIKPYVIFEDGGYKKVDLDLVTVTEMETYVSGSIGALSGFISVDEKGQPNGVATLDGAGKVPTSQIALTTDDVTEGSNLYFTDGRAQAAVVVSGIADGDTSHAPSADAVFDALAGKSDVGHTHVSGDITGFAGAVKSVAVADQIVDGVTDVAPSQNAVFDALALKASIAYVDAEISSVSSDVATVSGMAIAAQAAADQAQSEVDALEIVVAGKADASHTHVAADITDFTSAARTAAVEDQIVNGVSGIAPSQNAVFDALALKLDASEKGAANGVAELDSNGKVPVAQLPNSIMQYAGMWDASTNTPTLANGGGNADEAIGDVYRVSVSGTVDFGAGNISFAVGDYVILNDSKVWERSPGADVVSSVLSVNGQTGVVVLDTDDVNEGSTNLYYTAARFNSAFAGKTTNDLAEGVSGLYFTDERAQDAAAAMFTDTSTIDFTYSDGANQMAADVKAASITASHIAGSAIGNGLVGGAGTAIAVSAGEAIKVGSTVSVDYARSLQNDNAGTITVGQVVFVKTANGHVDLAQASVSGFFDSMIGIVEDSSIATNATGKVVIRPGKIMGGYSSLTPGLEYYVSRTVAGAIVKWADASFVTGDVVYPVGRAISTTEIEFIPGKPILFT